MGTAGLSFVLIAWTDWQDSLTVETGASVSRLWRATPLWRTGLVSALCCANWTLFLQTRTCQTQHAAPYMKMDTARQRFMCGGVIKVYLARIARIHCSRAQQIHAVGAGAVHVCDV